MFWSKIYINKLCWIVKIFSKQSLLYYQIQLSILYQRMLPSNPIVGSYDRIQHAIILDLDLAHIYLNMCYVWTTSSMWVYNHVFLERVTHVQISICNQEWRDMLHSRHFTFGVHRFRLTHLKSWPVKQRAMEIRRVDHNQGNSRTNFISRSS